MTRHLLVATTALAAVTLAGCSGPTSTPTPVPDHPAVSLLIPGTAIGEVSRTIVYNTGASRGSNAHTISDPVKGRSYVVRSACSAPGAAQVTLTYQLVDARASSFDRSVQERTVMSSRTTCDGQQHVDEVGPLAFPVAVWIDGPASAVSDGYTIVVPK